MSASSQPAEASPGGPNSQKSVPEAAGPEAPSPDAPVRGKRADAVRNRDTLLAAAGAVFVSSGIDAPIREIAGRAGVGIGTIYRHFPTRADLVVAVYRHQVEACAEAGPALLSEAESPLAALRQWVDLFVDFLVTKHGLAHALQSGDAGSARTCTPTSSIGSCRCARNCSQPPWAPARSSRAPRPTS